MYCPGCGQEVPDYMTTCPNCGTSLSSGNDPYSNPYGSQQQNDPYGSQQQNDPYNNPYGNQQQNDPYNNPYGSQQQNDPYNNPYGSQQQNDPYGAPPAYSPPGGGFAPPGAAMIDPPEARTAQTLSVVGLIMRMINVFPLVALILSIVGFVKAGKSKLQSGGMLSPSAKVGRIVGIIGIIFNSFAVLVSLGVLIALIIAGVAAGSMFEVFEDIPYAVEDFFENFFAILPVLPF
ncbi:MAG: zinc-ribbon domain-containing protein [Clostridia bacterium]|nr:zinc-ribbon domain-containing protein [Clostridia bacterium]